MIARRELARVVGKGGRSFLRGLLVSFEGSVEEAVVVVVVVVAAGS